MRTNVGLLTGDTSINGDAPVVVMTTEVLRNMLYADSATLDDLGFVVMDEVHYLADRFRGAVWEEVIIHLPSEVQVASLSATVSNAEEFGAWLDTVRGDTDVIVSEHRPVPLWQHVMVGKEIVDLFAGETTFDEIAPEGDPAAASAAAGGAHSRRRRTARIRGQPRAAVHVPGRKPTELPGPLRPWRPQPAAAAPAACRRPVPAGRHRARRSRRASRPQVIASLDRQDLLPAITFIFSRAGCDAAVSQCVAAGLWLTTEREQRIIAQRVDEAGPGHPLRRP